MGFIRGAFVFVFAIGIFFSLFAANLFLTISLSLNYNNAAPYLKNVSNELAQNSGEKAIILKEYDNKKILCSETNFSEKEINITFKEEKIPVPCEVIQKGANSVIDYTLNKSVDYYYYKNYECTFLECIQTKDPTLALVSQTAKDYWQNKFNSTILIAIALFALLFLFIKEKYSSFVLGGILTIFAAMPFKQITWVLSLIPDLLPFKIIPVFFTESTTVFTIMLVLGIILIAIGIGIKFFDWGLKISNLFRKLVKKKDKEEKNKIDEDKIKEIVEKEVTEELSISKNKEPKKK